MSNIIYLKTTTIFSLLTLSTALFLSRVSLASHEIEEFSTSKPRVLSEEVINKLGVLAVCPKELILRINDALGIDSPHMKIAMANTAMFTVVTGCTREDLKTPAFPHLASSSTKKEEKKYSQYSEKLTFVIPYNQYSSMPSYICMPSYIWKYVAREIKDYGKTFWPFLKGTSIHTVSLRENNIGDDGARDLTLNLKGTNVHTIDLRSNQIGNAGARDLAQNLQSTNVHTLILIKNFIGADGARELAKNLQGTNVHTVNLSFNKIGKGIQQELQRNYPHIKWIF